MADNRYFVDVFGEIVTRVRSEYNPSGLLAPYYIYGHPKEIASRLSLKDQNAIDKFRKFPLIALLTDFTEDHGDLMVDDYSLPVTVIIVQSTNKNYVSEERYANTFKPVLYPLYNLLLKYINLSPSIRTIDEATILHKKTDRLYWGSAGIYGSEGLIFNEFLDAIEINFKEINVLTDVFRGCQ